VEVVAMTVTAEWSVADAKAHFSEVLHRAEVDGPQVISRRGAKVAVVVAFEEFHRKTRRTGSLADFFARSPLAGSGLEIPPRLTDGLREVDL
jgi:prevent-host-death family protein